MKSFLCIGDTMMDISVVIDSKIHTSGDTPAVISTHGGGAAANVATWLAYLGNDAFLASRIGDDSYGQTLHAELDTYRVRHSEQRVPNEKSGVVVVLVNESGERTMFPDSGANSGLSSANLPPLPPFTAIYLSGYALINPLSRAGVTEMISEIKTFSLPIALDPGTVGALRSIPLSLIKEWVSSADLLFLNEEEALFIADESELDRALALLCDLTPLVIVKRGEKGAIAQARGSGAVEISARPSEVIDTTGAGDAFAAGFISAWFHEKSLESSLIAGAESASISITRVGARPPLKL